MGVVAYHPVVAWRICEEVAEDDVPEDWNHERHSSCLENMLCGCDLHCGSSLHTRRCGQRPPLSLGGMLTAVKNSASSGAVDDGKNGHVTTEPKRTPVRMHVFSCAPVRVGIVNIAFIGSSIYLLVVILLVTLPVRFPPNRTDE